MVFDFFKKRATEGIKQVENIAGKAVEGKLGEALQDTAAYVKVRREADAENFAKFTQGLTKSREKFLGDLSKALGRGDTLDETLTGLEEVLMTSDIGSATTLQIIDALRDIAGSSESKLEPEDVNCVLRGTLIEVLGGNAVGPLEGANNPSAIKFAPADSGVPSVLFVMGANGMGKTTTIGKIAARLKGQDLKVLLCAADTFRAAAVEQLEEWSNRAEVDIVKPLDSEERPESVAQRACERAVEGGYDVVVVDTSGRLSNNRKLNQELKAIKASIGSVIKGAPHETLLVVDASVGRNAFVQAKTWKSEVGVSGLAVTKLDGTARAGFVVSIVRDLGVPVKLIGVGEGLTDLRDFDAELFVDALLGYSAETAEGLRQRFAANSVLQERLREKMDNKPAPPKPQPVISMGEMQVSRKARRKSSGKKAKK
ncbi:PFtsY, plastid signal recognition particle receptor [Tribonema minus]|uniref:PFtsY, plastid signal recognition particle receptor n=1 Tax=Tribonema minus TaxID=303371 RepID=A0A835ZC86_9STRA|nr:PFtsY, plastid signal recognition particle receptor [Tribonema minus]